MSALSKFDTNQIMQIFFSIIFFLLFLLLCLQNVNYLMKIINYQNSTYFYQIFSLIIVLITFFSGMQAFAYITYWYLSSNRYLPYHQQYFSKNRTFPHVTILIPTYNEPPAIVEKNVKTAKSIKYPSYNIVLVDDSDILNICGDLKKISDIFNIDYLHRNNRIGYKAGAINNAVKKLDISTKYIFILDIEHIPHENILQPLVNILESDDRLSFIQSPQFYPEKGSSFFGGAYAVQQHIFNKHICRALSITNSCFMCGTNVLIRREHLDVVGGFRENTSTEDIATSFVMHKSGCFSFYHDQVLSTGSAPVSLHAYFIQQRRWCEGTIKQFKLSLKELLTGSSNLSVVQWLNYLFVNGTFYFLGWTTFLLILYPFLIFYFDIAPFEFDAINLSFIFFLVMLGLINFYGIVERNFSIKSLVLSQSLWFVTIPVYMSGVLSGFFSENNPFTVTPKQFVKKTEWSGLTFHTTLFVITGFSLFFGIKKYGYGLFTTPYLNLTILIIYQMILISVGFLFFSGISWIDHNDF